VASSRRAAQLDERVLVMTQAGSGKRPNRTFSRAACPVFVGWCRPRSASVVTRSQRRFLFATPSWASSRAVGRQRVNASGRNRSSTVAPIRSDRPDRKVAFAIARPSRAREQKQSCRARAAHAWIWVEAVATRIAWATVASCRSCESTGPSVRCPAPTSRRPHVSAPRAASSGTSSAFALTGSTSEGRERPFSSAPGAMRARRESLRPAARDHSDSRDRPTKQQRGAVAVATTAAGPGAADRDAPRSEGRGRRQRSVSSCESPLHSIHVHTRRRRPSNGGEH
jgi:hypothetical protein